MEPFTLVEETGSSGPHHLFDDVLELQSAKTADHDLQYIAALRKANPELIVTAIPTYNVPLLAFVAAGYATAELDTKTDSYASWRGYNPPTKRDGQGHLAEAVTFAKYHYKWNQEDFILYTVGSVQYVLKERGESENALGPSAMTDKLIQAIGDWITSISDVVWVYDGYWMQSRELYEEVQKAGWDKVILDEDVKKDLTNVTHKFFDSKEVYEDLGVPWKRGLLFHGPPGNGKTISIRALMKSLYGRENPIPTLYVKSAPYTFDIGQVFSQARRLAPCMLVLEDIETIVTSETRSYFFNEMDGLENNDGLFVVASTNFLDKLDPGLSKRPSRFDRKYKFPIPNEHERTLYCEFWRQKLKSKDLIEFPKKLCQPMAHITPGFSFAFLQECFVATLLVLARDEAIVPGKAKPFDSDNDDLEDYKLWVTFKEQADILRKEVDSQQTRQSQLLEWCRSTESPSSAGAQSLELARRDPPHCHFCHDSRESGRGGSVTQALGELRMKNDVLPQLSYRKSLFINSAAFELR